MSFLEGLSRSDVKLGFSITDPRRSFAGHTVYRVVLKLQGNDVPECSDIEVVLWRRYSEFRRLHRDLKAQVEKTNPREKYPDFIGPKLFGRFDDHVIEERRKSAAKLLAYIVERKELWLTDSFKKFVQTPVGNNNPRKSLPSDDGEEKVNAKLSSLDCQSAMRSQGQDEPQVLDGTSGTWSHRQLTPEGNDEQESSFPIETSSGAKEPGTDNRFPRTPTQARGESADDNMKAETLDQNMNAPAEKNEVDVFTEVGIEAIDDLKDEVFAADDETVARQGQWLRHAISVCSEGGDIERLASEAEDYFPMPSANGSPSSKASSSSLMCLESAIDVRCRRGEESPPPGLQQRSLTGTCSPDRKLSDDGYQEPQSNVSDDSCTILPCNDSVHCASLEPGGQNSSPDLEPSTGGVLDEPELRSDIFVDDSTADKTESIERVSSYPDFTICKAMADVIEEVVGEDDYIYQASLAMSEATEHEGMGDFASAFQLYKFGVGVLLHGVQQDENSGRREAVRRKTAQYLLKAETIYQTHLSNKAQSTGQSANELFASSTVAETEMQQAFSLSSLQVVGSVDKLMLVEDLRTGDEFIMKVLHKCGAEYKQDRNKSKHSEPPVLHNYKNCVRLKSYVETWTGIYLLLDFIPSGRLWDHLGLKLEQSKRTQVAMFTHSENKNEGSVKRRASYLQKSKRLARDDFDTDLSETAQSAFDDRNISPIKRTECVGFRDSSLSGKREKLNTETDRVLPEEDVQLIASQLVVAIEDLHSQGIICRDINPRNILIDCNGQIKLTYFSAVPDVDYVLDEEAVEKQYAAPEVDGVFEVTQAADWWSLGAILFELLTFKSLISCHPGGIHSHSIITLPRAVSRCALGLLNELLRYNPKDRLGSGPTGAEEIKAHPFFTGINWE